MTTWPDINSLSYLKPEFLEDLVFLAKCDGQGWIDLVGGARSTEIGPTFRPSPLGGYEGVYVASNNDRSVFQTSPSDISHQASAEPFTCLALTTQSSNSAVSNAIFGYARLVDQIGWALKGEQFNNTNNPGFTKWDGPFNNADILFSGLSTPEVPNYANVS